MGLGIVLYCIVLHCIVLYCIVLYCTVLYCIVSIHLEDKSRFLASMFSHSFLFYAFLLNFRSSFRLSITNRFLPLGLFPIIGPSISSIQFGLPANPAGSVLGS